MKSHILMTTAMLLISAVSFAQLQFNPQIGVNFTRLTEDPRDVMGIDLEVSGRAGLLVGADVRLGGSFYIQPGLFLIGSKTLYRVEDHVVFDQTEVTRYALKLKGLAGLKIIDSAVTIRAMAGPTYDLEVDLKTAKDEIFMDDNFKKGVFSIDAGVGADILFLTAEVGFSFGVTDVFKKDVLQNRPKYQSIYATVGVVFGK